MSYTKELFVPFHLGDPAGILFFGHIFMLSHEVMEEFVTKGLGLPWASWFQNEEWIVPVKQTTADYEKPILVGLPCLAELQVSAMGESSLAITTTFYQQEAKCATVKTVHVFCDRASKRKRAIPEALRGSLAKWL